MRTLAVAASICCGLMELTLAAEADAATRKPTLISAQLLEPALHMLATERNIQVVYQSEVVGDRRTAGAAGNLTAQEALVQLLRDTGLTFQYLDGSTVTIVPVASVRTSESGEPSEAGKRGMSSGSASANRAHLAQLDQEKSAPAGAEERPARVELEEVVVGVPEVLVRGSQSINADIRRTRDDMQPYVTYDAQQIQRSSSRNLQEFLNTRLPMNTQQGAQSLVNPVNGDRSSINLRGLGSNQTLILVDGRRMPNFNDSGAFGQPDINAIPLATIERIEILPATASGIYGGGATGGVINIITRKDYSGGDVSLAYGNTTRTDSAEERVEATYGFNLEGGRTHVLLSGSYKATDGLLTGDRDFAARGRQRQFANNPAAFFTGTTPIAGATSNIRSQSGANLQLKPALGGTNLDSPVTYIPTGYSGIASDNGAALRANAGKYNLDLPADILGTRKTELPETEVGSAAANLRREFGEHVSAFADFAWFRDRARNVGTASFQSTTTLGVNAPNNPFTTAVNVSFPIVGLTVPIFMTSESLRGTGGVIVRLPFSWTASAEYTWGRARSDFVRTSPPIGDPDGTAGPAVSAASALSNGTLDVMRDLNAFPLDFSPYRLQSPNNRQANDNYLRDAVVRLTGPLFKVPGGAVTLSAAIDRRRDSTSAFYQQSQNANAVNSYTIGAPRSQTNLSYYLETAVPLVSQANAMPFVQSLDLQLSVRRDEYETRAGNPPLPVVASPELAPPFSYLTNEINDTNYTAGLRFSPVQDLTLRTSVGTGLLPPSVDQLVPNPVVTTTFGFIDPKRGNTTSNYAYSFQNGGNPNLQAEESKSWSAGLILTPRFLAGARLSVDYIRMRKTNEITSSLQVQDFINAEDQLQRVTRAPLSAADQALGYTGGVVTFIDLTRINVTQARLHALDFQADYGWETQRFGRFHAAVIATYQPQLERQVTPLAAPIDSAGFASGILKWRGNAGLSWEQGPWTASWNAQYFDSYFVYVAGSSGAVIDAATLNQGAARIPSQLYHDVFVNYRFDATAGALSGAEIALGIQNLFDRDPPILATTTVGGYSTYVDARLRRFALTLQKRF